MFTLALSYLIPPRSRGAFLDWYAYLRWVDDQVDEAPIGAASTQTFLRRQFAVLDGSAPVESLTERERGVASMISDNRSVNGAILAPLIRDMLECIQIDAARRGGVSPYETLRLHWRKEVRAYLGAIACFCGVPYDGDPKGLPAAQGAKIAHVLRDLRDDIAERQINVSVEEIAAFALSVERLTEGDSDGSFGRWSAANARVAAAMLAQGLLDIRHCTQLRYKLIVVLLISKYQCYANILLREGLLADHPLRLTSYLQNLARDLLVVFARLPAPRRREAFAPIVRPTLFSRLKLISAVVPWFAHAETAHLQRSLGAAASVAADPRRMRRRFRVACLIGRTSLAVIAPTAARAPDVSRIAGLLYGYWSICAIELDRLMDEGILSPSQSQLAADGWLDRLHRTLFDAPFLNIDADAPSSTEVFEALTSGFMNSLMSYDRHCRSRGFDGWNHDVRTAFFDATASLMAGQLRSLRQMEPDSAQDWSWYRSSILNAKNVQFLLAPFNLWRVERRSEENFARFVGQFDRLNRTYLHYQLIDDVADLAEDTDEGIVGAPGAVLLSQGTVARMALASLMRHEGGIAELDNAATTELVDSVRESGLLAEGLADASLYDPFRHCFGVHALPIKSHAHADAYVRCALANTDADLTLSLVELAQLRQQEAQAFLDALKRQESTTAQEWLLRSGAPRRLLNAVGGEAAIIDLRDVVGPDRGSDGTRLLYILEGLMRHTHRAALDVVNRWRS